MRSTLCAVAKSILSRGSVARPISACVRMCAARGSGGVAIAWRITFPCCYVLGAMPTHGPATAPLACVSHIACFDLPSQPVLRCGGGTLASPATAPPPGKKSPAKLRASTHRAASAIARSGSETPMTWPQPAPRTSLCYAPHHSVKLPRALLRPGCTGYGQSMGQTATEPAELWAEGEFGSWCVCARAATPGTASFFSLLCIGVVKIFLNPFYFVLSNEPLHVDCVVFIQLQPCRGHPPAVAIPLPWLLPLSPFFFSC